MVRSSANKGRRFDAEKLLLDPYARAVAWPSQRSRDAAAQPGDNASTALKGVVVDTTTYDWEHDAPPRTPFARSVIYELHVGGFTRDPSSGVAVARRGTFAGVVDKIPYLKALGVTAVELLPVFAFDEQAAPPGLVNFLGLPAARVLRAAPGLQHQSRRGRRARRIPRHGEGAASRRHRGHSRRGLQPHRRR